jgi:hypothetical protein
MTARQAGTLGVLTQFDAIGVRRVVIHEGADGIKRVEWLVIADVVFDQQPP